MINITICFDSKKGMRSVNGSHAFLYDIVSPPIKNAYTIGFLDGVPAFLG